MGGCRGRFGIGKRVGWNARLGLTPIVALDEIAVLGSGEAAGVVDVVVWIEGHVGVVVPCPFWRSESVTRETDRQMRRARAYVVDQGQ